MDHTRSSRKIAGAVACGVAWLLLGSVDARAGFTIVLDSTAPNGGGATVFDYSAKIAGGDSIVAGDYFRIYDFGGYVAGSAVAPAGWSVSVSNYDLSLPPTLSLSHGDDAAIPNLTFTYTGTTPITGATSVIGFSALSPYGQSLTLKNFVGTNHSSTVVGGIVDSIGDVLVPSVGSIFPAPAPEPASVISTGLGLALAGLYFTRRGRCARSVATGG
jgi:hypothetical protein